MLPLVDLQGAFARSLMSGGGIPANIKGRLRPDEAMRIHRNTVMGALANALRLSHPSVDALVGEAYFDQAALAFIQAQPPRTASLSQYGDGFAHFLAGFAPSLPYLPDVARLDFAIDRALRGEDGARHFALEATITITLPENLAVLALHYPADEIRAALGDDTALASIVLDPMQRHLVVWRQDAEARLRPVNVASGGFLRALLSGAPAQDALAAAGDDQAATLAQLQADVFAAPFCTVIFNSEGISA